MQIRFLKAAIKSAGYSLVELLVVLGIITLLAVVGVPNLFGSNERYALDTTARKVEQMITDARTRSIAPSSTSTTGYAQIFQVSFKDFPAGAISPGKVNAIGDTNTNTAVLQSGMASCGTGVSQGSVTNLKTLQFPRTIYLSNFYPTNQSPTDTEAVIRFSIGKVGFQCGKSGSPLDSTEFLNNFWHGITASSSAINFRYLVLELSSTRVAEKRYIAIDRLNSEIVVSRTNPQAKFTPTSDTFAPLWRDTPAAGISLVCRTETSEISLSFPRAVDPSKTGETVATADPNRLVYYDIHWKQGSAGENEFQPLVSKYFNPLTEDTVKYLFSSNAVTTLNQPSPIVFRVWAFDTFTNYSTSKDFTFSRPNNWDCGNNGGNNCISKLPNNKLVFRPVAVLGEPFDLEENPCVSDTDNGSGNSEQKELEAQTQASPQI